MTRHPHSYPVGLMCRFWRSRIERHAVDASPAAGGALLERHLQRCPGCRAAWEAQQQIAAELRNSFSPPCSSPSLVQEMWAEVDRSPAPLKAARPPIGLALTGVGFAGILLLAALPHARLGTLAKMLQSRTGESVPEAKQFTPPVSPTQPGGVTRRNETAPHVIPVEPGTLPSPGEHRRGLLARAPGPAMPSTPGAQHPTRPTGAAVPAPDPSYLDGRDADLQIRLVAGGRGDAELRKLFRTLPPMRDGFVSVRYPRFADAQPTAAEIARAVEDYRAQAAVVDSRLYRKVTLSLKAQPLSAICDRLSTLTGVTIQVESGLEDENATVLVEEQPARDVMRGLGRLFGYHWLRSGAADAYEYTLTQDLRDRVAEEEMRSRDLHEALMNLDREMSVPASLLTLTPRQLEARVKAAAGPERQRLEKLLRNWSAYRVYSGLTPAQRLSLVQGERVELESGAANPEHRLPDDLRAFVLQRSGMRLVSQGGRPRVVRNGPAEGTPLDSDPEAAAYVALSMSRVDAGRLRLECDEGGWVPSHPEYGHPGYGSGSPVAFGVGPAAANPGNARANAALRGLPQFRKRVSIQPLSSCRKFVPGGGLGVDPAPAGAGDPAVRKEPEHLFPADVWGAVHRETGLPIIADAYLRSIPRDGVTSRRTPLFEALARAGDGMGVRWRKDEGFILARSTAYFWEKRKEVPRRLLERWREDQQANGALPLRDLLEIASLGDEPLHSTAVGKAVAHCWGIAEWGLVGSSDSPDGSHSTELLPYARLLASLTPAQRTAALSADGIPFGELTPEQRDRLSQIPLGRGRVPSLLAGIRLRYQYVPRGKLVWHPVPRASAESGTVDDRPLLWGDSRAAVLTEARKLQPTAEPGEIRPSPGLFMVTFYPAGHASWSLGGPDL